MSSLPSSWETFITTVCNASTTAIKYSEVTSAILTEAARRKSFTKDSVEEAYVVQGSTNSSNFNFWKEQMQDYLIVKGPIDPIENEIAP